MARYSRAGAALVAVAILHFVAPASAQDTTARLDSIFSWASPDAPGCVVGVSHDRRQIVSRAHGLANVDGRIPLAPASLFDIGSVQKQFVAAAVLLLAEDGRLSLSEDIRKYLPELPDYGHRITLDHLLTHTSGIRDWVGLLPLAEEGADVLEVILRQRQLNFVPGEEWSYSNSGYVLLKELVVRVSGMTFAEFARRRLFEPLGMTSSAYVPDILQATGERALAYRKEGNEWRPYMRLANERGGGAIVSTAGELLTWIEAVTSGRLGASVAEKLQEPGTLNNGRRLTYARGLHVEDDPRGRMVWHDGGSAGYGTVLVRFPEQGVAIATMCNFEPVSVSTLTARVADVVLPPADPKVQSAGPVAVTGVDVTGRAGLYFAEPTGEPVRLITSGGRLAIATGPTLVPLSAERFRPQNVSLYYRSADDFELRFISPDEFAITSMEGETTRYRRAQAWSPAAADLQAVDGRYRNDDLGTVFEIMQGTNALLWRPERSPEMTQELEPVARDTYMRGMQILRFRRDAAGAVTGFEYRNPLIRNFGFTRVGDRVVSAAPAPGRPAPLTPPAVPAPPLERLVGEYEMAPGQRIAITLDGGQLYGSLGTNPRAPLMHVTGATFGVGQAGSPATVTFALGADGPATALVLRQNGNERTLSRVR